MPQLLFEIGVEELPAAACYEAERQLPDLVRRHLGADPSRLFIGPRRLAALVEDLPERTADEWVKGPPVALRERAAAGFARKHGLDAEQLEERDGFLWARRPGVALADVFEQRLHAIVGGLAFSKSMTWGAPFRFSRPVRWLCALLDDEALLGRTTRGHRFTHGELELASAGAYAETLRGALVEPDAEERRRVIVGALDELGEWRDPLGKLAEVVHMVEWPLVHASSFDETYLRLPERLIVTAMQSHQRYFPLGGNRFALVANGGDAAVTVPGYTRVLEARLDDASFTFDRDVAVGIEGLADRLATITFFEGGGSFANKTERVVALVRELGGDEDALEAARLAKADQAAELVREFPDLEGHIGATYARLAGASDAVATAIDEHYLPDAADAPLPSTAAGRVVAAADKLDTLDVSFGLGHRPTGSRDPYGLRRAAIGVCRLADEGGLRVERRLLDEDVREFVEERYEGLLDVAVEFVRAARGAPLEAVGDVPALARLLAQLDEERLAAIHEIYTRAARIVGAAADDGAVDAALLSEPAERELFDAVAALDGSADVDELVALSPVVERFFTDVLVMDPDERLRANRLRLLRDVRDAVGRLGRLSELPL